MGRPIKYHYPRTRIHARIPVTTYVDLHDTAARLGTTVGEAVHEAVDEWLLSRDGLRYIPDMTLGEVLAVVDGGDGGG